MAKDKPHGPVSERLMRKFYGPSGYVSNEGSGNLTDPLTLPACMAPDGADPCDAYTRLAADNESLRKELDRLLAIEDATVADIHCAANVEQPVLAAALQVLARVDIEAERAQRAEAERDALRQDAERYRYVRDHIWPVSNPGNSSEHFDSVIDRERSAKP